MKIGQFLLVIMLIGAVLFTGCTTTDGTGSTAAPAGKVVNLNYGAGASTSSYFVWHVALSKVIDKYLPNINLTVIETGATIDDLNGLRDGYWDIAGHGGDVPTMYLIIRGKEPFVGKAFPEARQFYIRENFYFAMFVTQQSGVTKLADLSGKKFCPGLTGSNAVIEFQRLSDAIGIKPDFFYASWTDAVKALSDGHIIGGYKSSSWGKLDPSLKEVSLTKPLRIIGLNDAEKEKLAKAYPEDADSLTWMPKGTVSEYPNDGDFWVVNRSATMAASPRLSQEIGYQIVKAWNEHHDEVAAAYPGVKGVEPIKDLINITPKSGEMKLHAGVVQYAKELGLDVDPAMIPPEYKP